MKYPFSIIPVFLAGLMMVLPPLHADLTQDLAFTAFPSANPDDLGDGKILQAKGGLIDFQRGLTAQSLFVVNAAPTAVAAKLVHWNQPSHPELKVWFHQTVTAQGNPADFTFLQTLPDNSSISSLLDATKNGDPSLQLNSNEATLLQSLRAQGGDSLFANFWSQVIAGRISRFFSGAGGADPYVVSGGNIDPLGDMKSLLRSDVKVYQVFHPLLAQTPLYKAKAAKPLQPPAALPLPPADVYCECFDVEGTAALGTGALYQVSNLDGSIESADLEFYVNSGIYVSIELEKLWPVTINGQPETLVWRDDLVSTASVAYLHGTERLASGMIMLQDVKAAIGAFRSELK
jgi:hypothetical protein